MRKLSFFKPYFIIGENGMFYGAVWKYIFSCKAIYVDIELNDGYIADKEFYKSKLSAKFTGQMKNEEEKAEITMCKCKAKDFDTLVNCIRNIHNSALLQGYGEEYEKTCKRLGSLFTNNIEGYKEI